MRIQYFSDTDTLYIVLNSNDVSQTRDLDENTLLEMDAQGNLIALTLEHAKERVNIASLSYEQVGTAFSGASSIAMKQTV